MALYASQTTFLGCRPRHSTGPTFQQSLPRCISEDIQTPQGSLLSFRPELSALQRTNGLRRRSIILVFPALSLAQALFLAKDISCATTMDLDPIPHASVPSSINEYFTTSNRNLAELDDSIAWGDSIYDDPGDLHRIYFQNIDGLRNDADEIDLYTASMAQFQIGTFCWADPGLDFSQFHIRQKLKRPLRSYFTAAKSAYSSSILPKDANASSGY